MDTTRKQLVDDKRAYDIFVRVRARLAAVKIKTNEKYMELLLDEINKYFIDISTSTIDSSDLANSRSGPQVSKHNKLLLNITNDIDKIHDKRIETQNVITKAVNYLSTERVSLNNAVSKMHSRIINHKLRMSANDRNVTVFSEYFTADEFVDKKLSSNIKVDETFSALTLLPVDEKKDNSNAIDSNSIYVTVKLDNQSPLARAAIYPLCNQPYNIFSSNSDPFIFGFGSSLSDGPQDSDLSNLLYSTSTASNNSILDNTRNKIQQSCLFFGNIPESNLTRGEFELIFNDFANSHSIINESIYKAIKKSSLIPANMDIDKDHIIINSNNSNSSFNGSYKGNVNPSITDIGLNFNINDTIRTGSITAIKLTFFGSEHNLAIPDIDYTKSYIKSYDNNTPQYLFNNLVDNKITNSVMESKLLILDDIVSRPKTVYIAFKVDTLNVTKIKKYLGVLWKVPLKGTGVKAKIDYESFNNEIVDDISSPTLKYAYVYHDVKRDKATDLKDLNMKTLKSILMVENSFKG